MLKLMIITNLWISALHFQLKSLNQNNKRKPDWNNHKLTYPLVQIILISDLWCHFCFYYLTCVYFTSNETKSPNSFWYPETLELLPQCCSNVMMEGRRIASVLFMKTQHGPHLKGQNVSSCRTLRCGVAVRDYGSPQRERTPHRANTYNQNLKQRGRLVSAVCSLLSVRVLIMTRQIFHLHSTDCV